MLDMTHLDADADAVSEAAAEELDGNLADEAGARERMEAHLLGLPVAFGSSKGKSSPGIVIAAINAEGAASDESVGYAMRDYDEEERVARAEVGLLRG